MTVAENLIKPIIIEPDGPQGWKLGFVFTNQEQFKQFDNLVGKLDESSRHNLTKLKEIAEELEIKLFKP